VVSEAGGVVGVGVLMRLRRQELGYSLQRVADGAGCAKSLLSLVENEHRNPPDDAILRRVERVLGMPEGKLVRAAAWQRGLEAGGSEVREGVARWQDQERTARRLATLLKGSGSLDDLYRKGELRKLVDRLDAPSHEPVPVPLRREVPLINKVAAGYPREFTDLGYPARVADEYVRCPDLDDPDAFAARVVGDSMQPVYAEGDIVVFSPSRPVKSGMDCFARLEPDHETTFKRVYLEQEGGRELIRLQPLNSAYPPRVVEREQVAGLYAAVSVMRRIG
jgi:repressor LexA